MSTQQEISSPEESFSQFRSYDWDSDADFQAGLQAILAAQQQSDPTTSITQQARDEIALRAKAFFFQRKFGSSVDLQKYSQWLAVQEGSAKEQEESASHGTTPQTEQSTDLLALPSTSSDAQEGAAEGDTPYPNKYAQIVELILSGKPIPGILDIPDTLLGMEQSSKASVQRRRKPWETVSEPEKEEETESKVSEEQSTDDGDDAPDTIAAAQEVTELRDHLSQASLSDPS